jgi:hypothetical protein
MLSYEQITRFLNGLIWVDHYIFETKSLLVKFERQGFLTKIVFKKCSGSEHDYRYVPG